MLLNNLIACYRKLIIKGKVMIKQIIGVVIYTFAKHLPQSYSRIKMGQRWIRAICAKLIMKDCGCNVNIEKTLRFLESVVLVTIRE